LKATLMVILIVLFSMQTVPSTSMLFQNQNQKQMLTPEEATQVLTSILTKNPSFGPVKITSVIYTNGQYHISYTQETNCKSGTDIIDAYTGELLGGTRSQC